MADPTPRRLVRLPKQTLNHAWAPKLRRPILLTSRRQLHLWVMLEANPEVLRYCERPNCNADDAQTAEPDFWALYRDRSIWLLLDDEGDSRLERQPQPFEALLRVSSEELERHRVWIQNWMSLLPYLSCTAALDLGPLRAQVAQFFEREAPLEAAEHHFARIDSVLVRSAAVDGLHRGELVCSELAQSAWSPASRLRRAD